MTDLGLGIDATTVLYFLFGAGGTAGRVALSPTIDSTKPDSWLPSKRFVIETLIGGVAGFVLPYFGAILGSTIGLDAATVAGIPPIIKAGIIGLVSFSTSIGIGEIMGWVALRKKPEAAGK